MTAVRRISTAAWAAFACATLFYAYQFALRVAPSVMSADLMEAFGMGAAAFGLLAAFYSYGYAPFQVPAGAMCDLLSPRTVFVLSVLACVVGNLFFMMGSIPAAYFGRFLIGLGSATSFLLCIKVAATSFPSAMLPMLTSVAVLIGTFGSVGGYTPIAYSTAQLGWKPTIMILTILGGVLCLLGLVFIKKGESGEKEEAFSKDAFFQAVKALLHAKHTWIIGSFGFLMYVPIATFFDVWGVPFLKSMYGLEATEAGLLVSIAYIGFGAGAVLSPIALKYFGSYRPCFLIPSFGGVVFFLIMLSGVQLSYSAFAALMLLFGMIVAPQILAFALIASLTPKKIAGISSGLHNMICMLSGVVAPPLVGKLLHLLAPDMHQKPSHAYQLALLVVVAALVLAGLLVLFAPKSFRKGS